MLRYIRIALALVVLLAITAVFADFSGTVRSWIPWLQKIQLVPALLSLNLVVILLLAALTLVMGRAYCSVICPLGIFQDAVNWLHNHLRPKKKRKLGRFGHKPEARKTRVAVFAVFLVLLVLGLFGVIATSIVGLIDPYSSFGRMATAFVVPAYNYANNMLADADVARETYNYAHIARSSSLLVFVIASLTLLVVGVMAWVGGRDYCNKICPVGTLLGFVSRYAWLRPVIDTNKCNGCRQCARQCKSSCIDPVNHVVDMSRCVACMDCIDVCRQGAISYSHLPKRLDMEKEVQKDSVHVNLPNAHEKSNAGNVGNIGNMGNVRGGSAKTKTNKTNKEVEAQQEAGAPKNPSRRNFITTAAIVTTSAATMQAKKKVDGGLTELQTKKHPNRTTRVVPPGAQSIRNFTSKCTACQLCIDNCPSQILSPSTSLDNFLQPEMNFTQGYCRPECTTCSEVCPSGAISLIDVAQKSAIQIGRAMVDYNACISYTEGEKCGNCERHCPTQAIQMIETDGRKRPIVNTALCIGCGSCEYHCPVGNVASIGKDYPAIFVTGNEVHRNV